MNIDTSKKIKECFEITKLIILEYTNLYFVLKSDSIRSFAILKKISEKIYKNLIIEDEHYSNLSIEEAKNALKSLDMVEMNDSILNQRFKEKLENIISNDIKKNITSTSLELSYIPNDIKFGLEISLTSLIDIETLKIIKNNLDDMFFAPDFENVDANKLYDQYTELLFTLINRNKLTEFILLYHHFDVCKIDKIDIQNIFKEYNFNNSSISISIPSFDISSLLLLHLAENSINNLNECDEVDNVDNSFYNMIYIARINIIIRYLDVANLKRLLNFCNLLKKKNSKSINYISDILKKKLK